MNKWYVCAVALIIFSMTSFAQDLSLSSGDEVEVPTITPGATVSFPVEILNNSANKTMVDLEPNFSASRYSFLGGSYPGTGGSCANSLGPGLTCTMMLESSPANMGDHDDNLEFDYALLWFGGTFPPPREQAEIKVDGYSYPTSCTLAAEVTSVANQVIVASSTESVEVSGNSFSVSTTVSVPGLSISNLTITNPGSLVFDLTSSAAIGNYDLIISNECGSFTVTDAFSVQATDWIDLRTAAGVTSADPEHTTSTIAGYSIDASFGLRLNITNANWTKAVRFNGVCDSVSRDFDIVVYRTGFNDRLMVSLFSQSTQIEPYPGTTNSYQKQYTGFWNSGNRSNTTYGTEIADGGVAWSQGTGTKVIQTGRFYRYHFQAAGQNGGNVEVWEVDSNFNDIVQIGTTVVSNKPGTPASVVCAGLAPYDSGNVDYYVTGLRVR